MIIMMMARMNNCRDNSSGDDYYGGIGVGSGSVVVMVMLVLAVVGGIGDGDQ